MEHRDSMASRNGWYIGHVRRPVHLVYAERFRDYQMDWDTDDTNALVWFDGRVEAEEFCRRKMAAGYAACRLDGKPFVKGWIN